MGLIEIKLSEVMGRHRIKQRELATVANVRPAAINALYHGVRDRVDVHQLASILDGLNTLTGEHYTVADLLKYTPGKQKPPLTAAGVPYTGDTETDAVLNDHPDILNRVARIEQGNARLIPIADIAAKYGVKL
jgi:DNA-binding Xre family transcriptional regulator